MKILGLKIMRLRIIRMRIAGGGFSGEGAGKERTSQQGPRLQDRAPRYIDKKTKSSLFFFCRPHALDPPRHDADIPQKKTSAYMILQ